VRDWIDECPLTPIGAKVDPKGCPIDSDRDSVYDGLDKCPNTPIGAKVDRNGCPIDSDGDGVADGIDQCPDTPKGATVDAKGCPSDADGDGVLDGIDQCPNTPTGAKVDGKGCPLDSDGDGVYDGLDKCPDTPKGLKVDVNGCPVEMIERETELLDTGMIRLNNVNFQTGKDSILADSYPTLDAVGALLSKWAQLKMEISGHTDNTGSAKTNKKLSQARAQSVENYILSHHPELKAEQYTVKGYGSSKPIATNKTPEGKAQNRRVEFTVLNKDVLRQEIEKRTPVPADSTKK
jgi:OOP family OmpA-OmpF porin